MKKILLIICTLMLAVSAQAQEPTQAQKGNQGVGECDHSPTPMIH